MKDEVVIVDANFDQMTGPRGANDDDISVEIMDRRRIAQSMMMSSRARSCFHALFKNPITATIFAT